MKRVILIVLGVILLVVSVPLVIGGAVFAAIASGDDPTIHGRLGTVDSSGYAVVSDTLEVQWDYPFADRFDITVGAQNASSDTPVFIGYGPAPAVDSYLSGVPHTLVYGLGSDRSEREVEVPGSASPEPPGEQDFWLEQASGTGLQEIPLASQQGSFRLVVMNPSASQGLTVDVYGSMTLPFLLPVGITMLVLGLLLLTLGVGLLVWGIRSGPPPAPAPTAPTPHNYPPQPGPYYPSSGPSSPPGPYPGYAQGGPLGQPPPHPASDVPGPVGPEAGQPPSPGGPPPKAGDGGQPPG